MSRPGVRSLRVLHVITRMIVGGAQENTMLSCALIDRERFQSEILTGPETGVEGELHSECRRRGIRVHVEPWLRRAVHPARDLVALARLQAFMRRGRYDIVHTHASKAGILGRAAARMAGVPLVVHTAHGWAFNRQNPRFASRLYLALERACARLCDAIIVVSAPDRDQALERGLGVPGQYALIRSGIEIEAYRDVRIGKAEARARIGLPEDAFVVGSVGRLSRQKAPVDLVAAFVPVTRAIERAHLVLVGDGPLRAGVEAAVARASLAGRVHLVGLRGDVPELLRAFDVLALSSRWEGLPRVFPQAMAAGLPIVATRVSGAVEAITPGENGWLVDVGDTAAMAECLLALARDPGAARRMGEAGRSRVGEYSARRMVDELAALYERLAREKLPGH